MIYSFESFTQPNQTNSMPTVREIADYAGVSKSTVSLVLNNKPGVSEGMQARVLQAVEALNAEQDTVARAHSDEALSLLVLHPPTLNDDVFTEYLQGIWAGVSQYNVHLRLSANEIKLPSNHITNLIFSETSLRPDGVIMIGSTDNEPLLERAISLGIPCVMVHREQEYPHISTVGVDEAMASAEATQYLIDLGHRGIAFMGGDIKLQYTRGRLAGYKRALEQNGIPVPPEWIFLGFEEAHMQCVLQERPEITAIVCMNDTYAMEFVLPVLDAAGCTIPDDYSVVGFDNLVPARALNPPLSSISYPRYQEGIRVVDVLVEQIQNPLLRSQHIVFQTKFHKRASCGPPRQKHRSRYDD